MSERLAGDGVLRVDGVSKRYGGVVAVDDATIALCPKSISGLIGPNGAGKSTMVGVISGFIQPDSGSVRFGTVDITQFGVVKRARMGIARTFQKATPLAGLTVLENVLVGLSRKYGGGALSILNPFGGYSREEGRQRERARQMIDEFGLADQADAIASDLPFGQLRFLEIARALATEPAILLLDEPAAGLNGRETESLSDHIVAISRRGVGVLVIDHDVPFVFGLCQTVTVMDAGRIIATGAPREIESDPAVRAAYLSVKHEPAAAQA